MKACVKELRFGSVALAILLVSVVGCVNVTPGGGDSGDAGAKRVCSSDTACVFDGISNRALGAARLRLNDKGNLIVENIGSGGRDGVRQFGIPYDTVVMETGLACPNFVESVQGSKAEIIMYGDTPNELISTLIIENRDGETIVAYADLSPIGVTRYTVEIFNGDELVVKIPDLPDSEVQTTGLRDYIDIECGIHEDPDTGIDLVWIQYQLTEVGTLTVPGVGTFDGDIVRIKGQDQGIHPTRQFAFDNFFTNMPFVEMTFQTINSVFPEHD